MNEETTKAQTIRLGGNDKMEEQRNQQPQQQRPQGVNHPPQKEITMTGNLKSLLNIPLGVEPTGLIYTVATATLKNYFADYFRRMGYEGVKFANSRCKGTTAPQMYLAFAKNSRMVNAGKPQSEKLEMLMGTRSRGAHIRLDQKFHELVKPFCSEEKKPYVQSMKNMYYIEIDPLSTIARLFGAGNGYTVALLETIGEGKGNNIYRFLREFRATNNTPADIEELLGL